VPASAGILPPLTPPLQLVSVSPVAHGQVFRLDQVPELYISREVDHYASDSDVVFLVKASRENKPVKQTYPMKEGRQGGELTENAAEQHLYILTFSREGEYRKTVEIEDTFSIQKLGVFPSGTFLAFGFDPKDHTPKLALLKEDGTFLESLQIPKGGAPKSVLSGADVPHRGAIIAPTELVQLGRSILVVQNKTTFPLLEVSEGGMVRAIHPKLPKGEQIEAAIPADRNLYVIARPETVDRSAGVIYEVSPEDGTALRQFALGDGRTASDVACIHDGKFLSIDYGDGKVVPLIGAAEPAATTDQQKR
jgi:hypothetical protein